MLPFSYNHDRAVLLPVDPGLLFAYWDFSAQTWGGIEPLRWPLLLMLSRSDGEMWRFEIPKDAKTYYFKGVVPNARYTLTIAIWDGDQDRILMQSNPVVIPNNRPSLDRAVRWARFSFRTPPFRRKKSGHWIFAPEQQESTTVEVVDSPVAGTWETKGKVIQDPDWWEAFFQSQGGGAILQDSGYGSSEDCQKSKAKQ